MSAPAGWQEVADRIRDFLSESQIILFAGAGVGQRAGLPSWSEFIEHLAAAAEPYEPAIATLIRDRMKANRFGEAAGIFKLCQMPETKKYQALAERFSEDKYEQKFLRPLVSLPFSGIVTTNYDMSLLHAWSEVHKKAPKVADLGDPTLQAAVHWTAFVARIHGRAEIPESMVVTSDDFAKVQSNDAYVEFLLHIFKYRRCLILGYSFLDPAITSALEYIKQTSTPGVQPCHLALLSEGSDELAARLAELNVECVTFRRAEDEIDPYAELWGGISAAAKALTGKTPAPSLPLSLEPARHVLASAYVRSKMGSHLPALRDLIVEGALLSTLSSAGSQGLTLDELAQEIHECMTLTAEEAQQVIVRPLHSLVEGGACRSSGDRFIGEPMEDRLGQDIGLLVKGAMHRLSLTRGGRTSEESAIAERVPQLIREILEYALLWRGWDLGAEFAGATVQADPWMIINDAVEDKAGNLAPAMRYDISSSCLALLTRPTDREAKILGEIGRLSFAVYVILQHGRGPLLHRRILPEKIYLDASVAMPAIVEGHPLRPVYIDAFNAWRDACLASGVEPRLLLADVFMNEILRHREMSLQIVADSDLETREKLGKHILFRGAEYANVFISAYASWVGRVSNGKIPYPQWLSEHAPYTTRDALSEYLKRHSIEAVPLTFDEKEQATLGEIKPALQQAYDDDERSKWDPKPIVLISDEARQLARLKTELENRQRTLFVSADRRLRRLAIGPVLGYTGAAIISHVGLVELVDLLVGVKTEARSLYRLIWGLHSYDRRIVIRNYLTDQALKRQEEAMVMSLPTILDRMVEGALQEADRDHVKFWSRVPEEQARVTTYLDRVEDQFFEAMDEAVTKYKRELELDDE